VKIHGGGDSSRSRRRLLSSGLLWCLVLVEVVVDSDETDQTNSRRERFSGAANFGGWRDLEVDIKIHWLAIHNERPKSGQTHIERFHSIEKFGQQRTEGTSQGRYYHWRLEFQRSLNQQLWLFQTTSGGRRTDIFSAEISTPMVIADARS